jgi:hypothetical protein
MGPAGDISLCSPVINSGVLACRLQGVISADVTAWNAELLMQIIIYNLELLLLLRTVQNVGGCSLLVPIAQHFGHSMPISRPIQLHVPNPAWHPPLVRQYAEVEPL